MLAVLSLVATVGAAPTVTTSAGNPFYIESTPAPLFRISHPLNYWSWEFTIVPYYIAVTTGTAFGSQLPASAGGVNVNQFLGLPFATGNRSQLRLNPMPSASPPCPKLGCHAGGN